jgi:hypothetical protein
MQSYYFLKYICPSFSDTFTGKILTSELEQQGTNDADLQMAAERCRPITVDEDTTTHNATR